MKRRSSFNAPRSKKYRPTKAEQGLFTVRHVGEALPEAPSPDLAAIHNLAAMKWGANASIPKHVFIEGAKGVQKRNLRRSDLRDRLKATA